MAIRTSIPVMTATVGGTVPTPPNNTTTFLRGDGTFNAPAGASGGSFEQAFTTVTSVVVTHNLGAYPVVDIIDSGLAVIIPLGIVHSSVNAFTATFTASTTGTIIATLGAGTGDMKLASIQTVTGVKTFNDTTLLLRNVADTFNGSFTNTNSANRVYTLPNAAGTVALTSDITGTNSGTNTGDNTVATALTGSPTVAVTAIELGHATDTTIARVSAGVASIEGERITTYTSVTVSTVATTAADVVPINVPGCVFTYVSGAIYEIRVYGRLNSAAATTGCGLQFDVSTAITDINVQFFHQLASAGTLTGGHSIADHASVGLSSGVPAGPLDVPITLFALFRPGANTGTCQLRIRSEVAAVTELMAGAYMIVQQIA